MTSSKPISRIPYLMSGPPILFFSCPKEHNILIIFLPPPPFSRVTLHKGARRKRCVMEKLSSLCHASPLAFQRKRQSRVVGVFFFFPLITQFRLMESNREPSVACTQTSVAFAVGIASSTVTLGGREPVWSRTPRSGLLPRPPGLPRRLQWTVYS